MSTKLLYSKFFKTLKKHRRLVLIIITFAFLVTVGWLVFDRLTMPVQITKVETRQAISSRTLDAPITNKFHIKDPIMLYFEFSGAPVGKAVSFEVKNDASDTVKNGSTTVLRVNDGDSPTGQRYVSIVNSSANTLPVGNYIVALSVDNRAVGQFNFTVVSE
jgi:hypothetical protein